MFHTERESGPSFSGVTDLVADAVYADTVYKVCPRAAWEAAVAVGRYTGSADDLRDGFIHLSTGAQLPGTLARHFRAAPDLVLIALPAAALAPHLRWEPSRGGDLFPHLYAPLDTRLAARVLPLATGADGVPIVPEGLA